jgi:FMN-dependent NADH-azoreductase
MKYLVLKTSILNDSSYSNKGVDYMKSLLEKDNVEIIERNLGDNIPPILDAKLFSELHNGNQESDNVKLHDNLIDELLSVDNLVVGVPMYNFGIPIQLKAYIDAVARAGKTFKYNEKGEPVGLTKLNNVFVVFSRGGIYSPQQYDAQEKLLEMFFKFIGAKNVNFLYIQGIALGADESTKSYQEFTKNVDNLLNK